MVERPETINFKYNFKIYWSFLKKYKWVALLLLLVVLLSEASYIANKYLFKIIVDKGTEFVDGKVVFDSFTKIALLVAVVYLALVLFQSIMSWLYLNFLNHLDADMIYDLKRRFFNHIIGLSYSFHTSHRTGSLISRLVRGGRAIERMNDTVIMNFAPTIFQFIIAATSIIYFDLLSAGILAITVALFITYSVIINNLKKKANKDANDQEDFEKANIGDFITNIESIKYFGKELFIKHRFDGISTKTKNFMVRHWNYYRWLEGGQAIILGFGLFFIIYFPFLKFLNGQMSLGTIVFIFTVFSSLTTNLHRFVWGIREFYNTMADFESLFQYSKIENDIKDKPNVADTKIRNGRIEFKNISFSYKKRKIFDKFNLTIEPKMKVALVGHSGSGKSTLVKLLYRLYDVNDGEIIIDGRNVKDFNQEFLREEMSIVPQECVLFDDTIYSNIAFSNPHATKEEVFQAIKFAHLDKLISAMPEKENTIVGERGVKLSGGEKQRVSIARAILANKKVLVLDEATSSLDSKTENDIRTSLEQLMEGKTVIIIAHRLSTIMNSDIIVVLDKGKIVEMGKHNNLIRKKGIYRELWELQKGGYIEV